MPPEQQAQQAADVADSDGYDVGAGSSIPLDPRPVYDSTVMYDAMDNPTGLAAASEAPYEVADKDASISSQTGVGHEPQYEVTGPGSPGGAAYDTAPSISQTEVVANSTYAAQTDSHDALYEVSDQDGAVLGRPGYSEAHALAGVPNHPEYSLLHAAGVYATNLPQMHQECYNVYDVLVGQTYAIPMAAGSTA